MKTIRIELETPVAYANGSGVEVEANFIEISEPTGKIAHLIGILKAEIGSATRTSIQGLGDLASGDSVSDKENTPEETGEAIFSVLTMGGGDMPRVMTTFKEVLRSTARVGGEKDFTAPMFDRLAYNDVELLLKGYLGNFMQASGS